MEFLTLADAENFRLAVGSDGRGKVTIELQGRSVELNAVTDGEAIAAGKVVRVAELLPNETVKVEAV